MYRLYKSNGVALSCASYELHLADFHTHSSWAYNDEMRVEPSSMLSHLALVLVLLLTLRF